MNISDEMVKNLKREEEKILFKGYVQGKCNEEMYNEMKAEIAEKRDALQKTMERYNATDTEIDDICEKIIDVTVNAGKILKSPIISLKRDFLRLILSDFFTDGKNVVFSITKPFDKLLRTAQINKWCALLCDYVRAFHTAHLSLLLKTSDAFFKAPRQSCAEHFRRYDSGLIFMKNTSSWGISLSY